MCAIQQSNSTKKFRHLTVNERFAAGCVFLVIIAGFGLVFASTRGWLDMSRLFGVCGFKQMYGIPCPGCYMTHSAQAFVQGRLFESFYIQPAGAVFCLAFAATAVFALLIASFGVDFGVLRRDVILRVFKYILVLAILVILGGWAVTLARTFGQGGAV